MCKSTILIVALLFGGALAKGHSTHGTPPKQGRGLTGADLASLKAIAISPRLEQAEKLEKAAQSAAVSRVKGKSMEEEEVWFFGGKALEEECSKLTMYLAKISNPPPEDVIAGIRLAKCAQCINKVCAKLEPSAQSVVLHWALDQAWQCAAGIAVHAIHHASGLSAIAGAMGECTKGVIDNWLDISTNSILQKVNFLEAANAAACQTVCEEYSSEGYEGVRPYDLLDVTGPKGLKDLNAFMAERKYFNGEKPCKLDLQMHTALSQIATLDEAAYPNVARYLATLRADNEAKLLQGYKSIDYR